MVLKHGRTTAGIGKAMRANIRTEVRAGYPVKQAVAIAMSTARRDAKRAHVRPPKGVRK